MNQVTVLDIGQLQQRISKVVSFVWPDRDYWEQTCWVEFHAEEHAAFYRIGFGFPRCARIDGDFPKGPDGFTFIGATVRLSDWDDVLMFADWIEGIKVHRLASYK